jgi:NAD-dependent dihydropyrimidine dehydrogenase PreA subunit
MMSHLTVRSAYRDLADRLNRFPQGAPPTDRLFDILALLFSEREAGLVAQLPIRPFTADEAARRWNVPEAEARRVLDELAGRAILLDVESPDAVTTYVLPPPMAGFFEFSMMRAREDVDQKLLAELFHQYLNVEEDFVRDLFGAGETRLGRVFVNESAVAPELSLHVLDYERASEVVKTARAIGVGLCYCRHKKQHLGQACDAPLDICMTFNTAAASLTRHGVARRVDAAECLNLLQQARDRGLVQFGENARRHVSFICNCCGCCCEALVAARRIGFLHPVHTTNFIIEVDRSTCTGCAKCVDACPVEALSVVSANDPKRPRKRTARLDERACLGCGVCVATCQERGLRLVPRAERVITPVDSTHRFVQQAIERGMLQNLIFDNHALASHRAMAAILGVILRLPPIKRAMASRQLGSRYLERMIERAS